MHTRRPRTRRGGTRPISRERPERRGAQQARGSAWTPRLAWLVGALLLAGCQRDSDSGENRESAAGQPAVQDSGAPASSGPASPTGPAAPTPEDSITAAGVQLSPPAATPQQPGTPPATAQDSLAVTLTGIMSAQERILARLDSMEAARPAAGTEGAAPTETGGIDLEEARDEVTNLGLAIFWSILVLILFRFLIRGLIWILETLAERSVRRRLTFKWLIPITRMLLWGVAAYLIVRQIFRVDAQGILAASAALGVALGFAAQDLLKNVFGGLIVVFDQPFQVGDKISVGGTYGEVVSIGLRSTRIVTADDDFVSVPNSQVVEEQVANANAGELNCQVLTNLYLPGRVDERAAKEIAFEAAVNSKYVFLEKPIQVFIEDEFHTTFVTRVKVRAYVLDPRFEFLLRSDITERARDGFRAAGLAPEHDWYPLAVSGTPGAGDTVAS
ncbi:MAG: mechanosensitive ion channel [Gemmatimonadota bacterium]|nr:mechanosensitive ion channel [Gemmatimonadota bacterium]MDE2986232.1 mechanosensitive ion channel [Gemmatimonadota bacterium]